MKICLGFVLSKIYYPVIKFVVCIFYSPGQRPCELMSSLDACHPLNFYILILFCKTAQANGTKIKFGKYGPKKEEIQILQIK